jgi:hypothetical protein
MRGSGGFGKRGLVRRVRYDGFGLTVRCRVHVGHQGANAPRSPGKLAHGLRAGWMALSLYRRPRIGRRNVSQPCPRDGFFTFYARSVVRLRTVLRGTKQKDVTFSPDRRTFAAILCGGGGAGGWHGRESVRQHGERRKSESFLVFLSLRAEKLALIYRANKLVGTGRQSKKRPVGNSLASNSHRPGKLPAHGLRAGWMSFSFYRGPRIGANS